MAKQSIKLSLDAEVKEQLQKYAEDNNTTVSTYWHDDGNRSEIIGLINQIIQVNIE